MRGTVNIHGFDLPNFLRAVVGDYGGPSFSLRRRANARNVSFQTLYGGQFTLSTQLITLNYPVILSHQCSTTVSLETCPFIHIQKARV